GHDFVSLVVPRSRALQFGAVVIAVSSSEPVKSSQTSRGNARMAQRLSSAGALLIALTLAGCQRGWRDRITAEGNIESPRQPSLHYRVLGSGPDTAIVLHGGPGLHMRYLLEPLASVASHHTLIFYDLRGRGESGDVRDSTEMSLEQDIADVLRVQEHFKL